MQKLKVLQFAKYYHPALGGIEKVALDLSDGIRQEVDMKVLVCQNNGKRSRDRVNGVEVLRSSCYLKVASMPISFSLWRDLKRESKDRDIIHFHMPFPLGDLLLLLTGYQGKIIAWWHSDIVKQKFLLQLYKPIMTAFLKRADCIMVSAERNIESSGFLAPYKDKCVVIPYGVDPKSYQRAENIACLMKNDGTRKNILFIGRLVYYKGLEHLLKAFQNIKNADLWLIGTGKMHPKLLQLSEEYGLADRVHFLGTVDAATRNTYLQKCDIFVLPSVAKSEAFGLVQLEAMACGKPVINTLLPTGVPYVSEHGQTGITVEPGDIKSLTEAMQTLVDDDALRERYGKNAQKRVAELFTTEKMITHIWAVYETLCSDSVSCKHTETSLQTQINFCENSENNGGTF